MPKNTPEAIIDSPFVRPGRVLGGTSFVPDDGGGGGELELHTLSGEFHEGFLADAQAPQFLLVSGGRTLTGNLGVLSGVTIDGVDISAHAADPDAHHQTATAGDGIAITGQLVSVDLATDPGLEFSSGNLRVKAYNGITRDSNGIGVKLLTGMTALEVSGSGLAIANGIAGAGLIIDTTTKILGVGAGDGIVVNANDVALNPLVAGAGLTYSPGVLDIVAADGSITVGANNLNVNLAHNFTWSGTHQFNSDPQVNSNLDFIGGIRNITTASTDNLNILPGGDLVLDPGGSNVLPGGSIEDDLGDYNRKWRTLYAAELYVETLVAQDVLATIGGRIIVAPTTTLIANVSSGAGFINVKHNNLPNGSYVMLQTAPGGVAQFEVMKIATAATPVTGGYQYGVSPRNLDGSGANSWVAGDAVVSLGNSVGDGYIELTSTETIHNHLGPTIAIYSRTGTGTWNATAPVVAMGNLSSFAGYSGDEFGFAVGNDLELDAATGFKGMTADRTDGVRLFNTSLYLYDGVDVVVALDQDDGLRLKQDTSELDNAYTGIHWYETPASSAGAHSYITSYVATGTTMSINAGALTTDEAYLSLRASNAADSSSISISTELGINFNPEGGGVAQWGAGVGGGFNFYHNTSGTGLDVGLTVEQDGAGDSSVTFLLTGGQNFSIGIDNSDGDKFKISDSADVGVNPILTIDPATDSVGINRATPLGKLHITDNTGSAAAHFVFSGGVTSSYTANFLLDDAQLTIGHSSALRDLALMTGGATRIRITGGGFVGIGDSTPVSRFHIYANTTSTGSTAGQTIEQAGTGDSVLHWVIGASVYSAGIDNSDGDKWKLSTGYTLGATGTDIIVFDPVTGETTIAGITVGGSGGGDHDPVTAGDGITVVGQQVSVDGTVVRTSTLAALDVIAGAGLIGGGALSGDVTLNIGAGAGIIVNANDVALDFTAVAAATVTITAGSGLTGGGDLSTNRTINVGAGDGISVAADSVAVDSTVVRTTRTVTAGTGLTGGGALSANITLNVIAGDGISVAADSVAVDSTVVRTTRTLTAGAGLTGGGTLAADRTFTVGAGDGITVNADDVAVQAVATGGLTVGVSGVAVLLPTISGLQKDATGLWVKRRGDAGATPGLNSGISMNSGDGLFLADSMAGNGLAWDAADERVLSVAVGNGLQISSDAVRVNQAFNFSWTGSHQFDTGVVTFNTDPQIDANLDFTGSARSITSAASLTITPTGDLTIDPSGLIYLPNAQELRTISFTDAPTGILGMRMWDMGSNVRALTVGAMRMDNLYARVFTSDEVRVRRGEQIWSKSYGIVETAFTLPAMNITVSVWFENAPASGTANLFAAGDYLQCRTIDWGTGLAISTIWFEVNSLITSGSVDGYRQRWMITRRSGGTTGAEIEAGSEMADFGDIGDGIVHVVAYKNSGGPMLQVGDITSISGGDDFPLVTYYTRLGNLDGAAGISGATYGLAAGNDLSLAPTTGFSGFTATADDGLQLYNTDLLIYDSGALSVSLTQTEGLRLQQDTATATNDRLFVSWWDDLDAPVNERARIQSYDSGNNNIFLFSAFAVGASKTSQTIVLARQDTPVRQASLALSTSGSITPGETSGVISAERIYLSAPKTGIGIAFSASNQIISTLHIYEDTTAVTTAAGVTIEQDGTGDALLQFLLTGGARWMVGIDNSASDVLAFSSTGNLSTTPEMFITAGGGVTIAQDAFVIGNLDVDGSSGVNGNLNANGNLGVGGNTILGATSGAASTAHVYENTTAVGTSAGLTIEQDSTGDAIAQFLLTGGQRWVVGIDNSASGDPFRISPATDLANQVFSLSTAGALTLASTLSATTVTTTTSLISDILAARTAAGLSITDDGGNLGVFIEDGGFVGINITNPTNRLHVVETVADTAVVNFTVNATDTAIPRGFTFANTDQTSGSAHGLRMDFTDNAGTATRGAAIAAGKEQLFTSTTSTRDGYLYFMTALNGTLTEWMRITSGGHVGIGTTTPGVDVVGTYDMTAARILQIDSTTPSVVIRGSTSAALDLIDTGASSSQKWMNLCNDGGITKFRVISDTGTVQTDNIVVMDHPAGYVGINTASPGARLDVITDDGGITGVRSSLYNSSNAYQFIARRANGSVASPTQIAITEGVMSIGAFGYSSGGWLANPSAEISVLATEDYNTGTTGKGGAQLSFFTRANGASNVNERFRISESGQLWGNVVYSPAVAATNRAMYVDNTGFIGTLTSSLRYKEDVRDLPGGYIDTLLDGLRPVLYKAKDDKNRLDQLGFIAEEVDALGARELVSYEDDGQPHSVHYERFIVPTIGMVQKLWARVNELSQEVARLQRRLN